MASEVPALTSFRGRIDLEIGLIGGGPQARLWAFLTATENATGKVALYFPAES